MDPDLCFLIHTFVHQPDGVVFALGERHSVNSDLRGTKAAALYHLMVGAGDTVVVRCRLSAVDPSSPVPPLFGTQFDALFTRRISDTDRFYSRVNNTFHFNMMFCRIFDVDE